MSAICSSPTGLIFTSAGSKPLAQARVSPGSTTGNGAAKRVYCKEVKSYGVELKGARTTRLDLPPRKRDSLGVTHRYLVFQVQVPAGRDFAVELIVSDTNHFRYRLILSTAISSSKAMMESPAYSAEGSSHVVAKRNPGNPLHFQLPLRLTRTRWTRVVVDVVQLTQNTFGELHGAMFRCVDAVAITANCRLRNIFSALENPIAVPSTVPAHLKLRMADGRQPCTVFVDGLSSSSNSSSRDSPGTISSVALSPSCALSNASTAASAPSTRSNRSHVPSSSRTPRLPLPSPVPTLVNAPGAAAAAAMVSPSLPGPPPSVKLAFGTRVNSSPDLVNSAAGPSPPRSGKKIQPISLSAKQKKENRRRPLVRPPVACSPDKAANYWDELPRRRFPRSTDENDEPFQTAGNNQKRFISSPMDMYGEGSPLSPPIDYAFVKDAVPSPSLGSEAEIIADEMQAISGAGETVVTPVRLLHTLSDSADAGEEEENTDHEPEATPPREYDDYVDDMHDDKEEQEYFRRSTEDDCTDEHDDLNCNDSNEDLKEAMDALRVNIIVQGSAENEEEEQQQQQYLEEEDEPFERSCEGQVELTGHRAQLENNVVYLEDFAEGYENGVEAATYVDDEDTENDEEAAAKIAFLYSQLELKRRQIARMEAEFSDTEVDDRDQDQPSSENEEDELWPQHNGSEAVGSMDDDLVNMGDLKNEDGNAGEDDEELIFDPILDCYYSPRTNTYFERP